MGNSRIEQIIDELNDYIDECRPVPLSKANIIVQKDAIQEYLDQLRISTPDEIKRYQKIISNRDAILKEAENKAADIIKAAEERAEALVSEHEVFQQACAKAHETLADAVARAQAMVDEATNESDRLRYEANRDSDKIRTGALAYANDMLAEIENSIGNAYESINAKSSMLVSTLKANLDTIIGNRLELNGEAAPSQQLEQMPESELMEDAQNTEYGSVEDEIMGLGEDSFFLDGDDGSEN